MKRLGYAAAAILFVFVGINEFIRVTPNDEGIIWFWLSQKFALRGSSARPAPTSGWTDREKLEILGHLTLSMESSAAAEDVLRRKLDKGQQPTKEDIQTVVANIKRALSEATLVTDAALYKLHPDFPEQFREKYRLGLTEIARGLSNNDKREIERGAALYQEFKDWGKKHLSALTYPPK
jgi:hypothetical protein